jgi:hypothetical protein
MDPIRPPNPPPASSAAIISIRKEYLARKRQQKINTLLGDPDRDIDEWIVNHRWVEFNRRKH